VTGPAEPRQAWPVTAERGPADSAVAWWREQRPPAGLLHLDSAAAGRSSIATLAASAGHAEREATRGAYVALAEAAPVLGAGRAELAALLGVPAAGLAFTESADSALAALLAAWPLRAGDTVAVVASEWGPNLHAFTARGLRLAEIPVGDGGVADLAALERMLASDPPALVHLDQVASHRTLVQPVAAAASLCRAAGVPLWVDAAQALGHVDTACGADAVYATSRKWLTGPRGVGVLGVAEPWWDSLRITASDLVAAPAPRTPAPSGCWMGRGERGRLDRPVHGRGASSPSAGPARVWDRLAAVGRQTREALADLPGWAVATRPVPAPRSPRCAPAARTSPRPGPGCSHEHGIVTTAGAVTRAPREMTEPLLRISPHVDCTPEDLARLRTALQALS
jgi:pyridoxal 5-phosphate dependent beta-lyase